MTPTDHGATPGPSDPGKTTSSGSKTRETSVPSGSGSSGSGSSGAGSSGAGSSGGESSGGGSSSSSSSSSSARPQGGRSSSGAAPGRRPRPGDGRASGDERVTVLIAPGPNAWAFGPAPVDLDTLAGALEAEPGTKILRRIAPPPTGAAGRDAGASAVLVAEMPATRAADLGRNLRLIVELDAPLEASAVVPTIDPALMGAALPVGFPAVATPPLAEPFYGAPLPVTVVVSDSDGGPVADVLVAATGRRGSALGVTDKKGQVELTVFEESATAVRSLCLAPSRDHWGRWIADPRLDAATANHVVVERIDATFPGFPARPLVGWGLRVMRIDQLPPTVRGKGVRIALVDSGAATGTHPDLRSPSTGFDLVAGNATAWKDDALAHGTHSLGVVAAGRDEAGMRGIAPEADVVVLKVLPGGRCSALVDAIDRCIEEQVDVIHLGLCSTHPSAVVEQRLQHARRLGIACIAAAGNTGGPVAYPAASAAVLAVAAVGRLGEFPPDSLHALQPASGVPVTPDGFFAARLSAHGWEIDVCGPGVAVVSTVPPDGYAAWDGTSVAAAHVSGLAALLLAHHPDFAGPYRARTAARVDRLFDLLRRNARPLPVGDIRRTGAGLPDAVAAFRDVLSADGRDQPWLPGSGTAWSPAPGAAWWPEPTIDLTVAMDPASAGRGAPVDLSAPLDQLAAVLHDAGIVNGNGGGGNGKGSGSGGRTNREPSRPGAHRAPGSAGGPAGAPDTFGALAQLRATLEQVGLWEETR